MVPVCHSHDTHIVDLKYFICGTKIKCPTDKIGYIWINDRFRVSQMIKIYQSKYNLEHSVQLTTRYNISLTDRPALWVVL